MNYRYTYLSPGYLGKYCESGTINSQYYGVFFDLLANNPNLINQIIVLPQRIPRRDFFRELYELETDRYRSDFNLIVKKLLDNHQRAFHDLTKNDTWENSRRYLNWSYVLMRYGYFKDILNNFPAKNISSCALEMCLLKELTKTQILLSDGNNVVVDDYLYLVEKFLTRKETTIREKILLLNQTIVNFYRHQQDKSISKTIHHLSDALLKLLAPLDANNFMNILYSSVAYRGLAMDFEYGTAVRFSFLNKAEQLARTIHCKTTVEQIIAKDNLFTCIQSLSKWYLQQQDSSKAEEYLTELISIDPFDATGFSELGFFYFNLNRIEAAADCFEKAMQLGPPGSGMNAYYYAKCLEQLGDEYHSIKYLYEATKLDTCGVSAWLDLLFCFIKKKQIDKASDIAHHLYESLTLFEQLEDEEKATVRSFIE
ncbi:tetratricopeptide repeat protein [Legionella spiritensis]|uniref:tetratricopeptide repeat protein n=1 Tax=Legionella spiritensis TaxID=452 RepID=UPI000F6E2066|nr:hypothetical protein [Legionella spiritensis]VEG92529.1 Predicted O-linked N-acetylglucosamine transferase, SPINDLY family [Legionella spiritensis]